VSVLPGYGWISLTTDYGLEDGFVAMLHGVIAARVPHVRVIDVTHEIPSQGIARGAAVLAQTVPYLPASVHVAVVDPGVGTGRRGVAVRTPNGILIGPDNGLLLPAVDALGGAEAAVELTNTFWHRPSASATFHGRDIFAPVAARLAEGAAFTEAGAEIDTDSLVRLPAPVVTLGDGFVVAGVLTVDRFGNVQLAAPGADALAALGAGPVIVDGRIAICGKTFGDAPPRSMVVFSDSAGYLAIAINGGSAQDVLGAAPGDTVRLDRV
jgi:S-adenosyl-L-methionine hydrolase (adenosine-forming)